MEFNHHHHRRHLAMPILITTVIFSTFLTAVSGGGHSSTLELELLHAPPADPRLSWPDSVLQMQSNDAARLRHLYSLLAVVPVASGRAVTQNPTYIAKASLGTPPQTLFVAVDTSNDAAWVPCAGCVGCSAVAFDHAKSSTFKTVPCGATQCSQVPNPSCGGGAACGFNLTYGGSTIAAALVQDNITLATDTISGYTFGCIQAATGTSVPAQGLLGLGRGPLSLISQTASLYQSTFSYCLPAYKSLNFTGSLRLGAAAQPPRIRTTQLLKNPRRSSFYYVNLVGIKVGRRGVAGIPPAAFAFDPNTGAGTIFDSGTVFTVLVKAAYVAVRDEFRRQMGNASVSALGGFDTCYTVPITVATMTFKFAGLDMNLPPENFLIRSSAGTTSCLAMAAAPDAGVNAVLNVIATFQQQNQRVLVDAPNARLGVRREQCS
ncbi:aspartyl protease AED3-like [Andrographis paniculata]|uniref:aspartyl protease AED3-like n=1 Tax=Andrographis paniculata TaxID=175694 RepID=UPI0021E86E33|nr:aspartyl protease AED3-like [Andrographis paniculata]